MTVFQLELRSRDLNWWYWQPSCEWLGQATPLWLSPATIASSHQISETSQLLIYDWNPLRPDVRRSGRLLTTWTNLAKISQTDQQNHIMDLWAISASSFRLSFKVDCRYWKQINIPEFPVTHLYMGLNSALLLNNSFNISVLIEPQSVPYYNIACTRV